MTFPTSLALIIVSVVVLSGCSGTSEEPAGPDPSATSDVAAPLDDETALSESICTQLDGAAVAEAVDQTDVFATEANTSTANLPVSDTCSIEVGAGAAASPVTFGWSAETVDAAGWQSIKDYWEKAQGQYSDITSVDAGDDAFFVFNKAYALVGDRVVSALYTVPTTPPEQFEALLQLAASAADQLPEPVGERRGPECAELDTEAAAALGDEPTITRGSTDDQLTCIWGTSSASISLSGFEGTSTAVEELEMDTTSFDGTSVGDLGVAAAVFDDVDGTRVQWITAGGTTASVRTAVGLRAEPDDLIALAKAAASSYE